MCTRTLMDIVSGLFLVFCCFYFYDLYVQRNITTLCSRNCHNCDHEHETTHFGPRIIGGEDVLPRELPFQVSIQRRIDGGNDVFEHHCGGSIIDKAHVLTAAHCFKGLSATDLIVVAGVLINTVDSSEETKVVRDVTELYVHEQYNDVTIINDIALIKVSPDFPTDNPAVKPIKLRKEAARDNVTCTVSGWGQQGGDDKPFPTKLQVTYVYLIPYEECRSKYRNNKEFSIQPGMICAESIDTESSASEGDSGGPLQSEGLLTGIVSCGMGYPSPIYPDVYTDVAYHKEWIEEHLRKSKHEI